MVGSDYYIRVIVYQMVEDYIDKIHTASNFNFLDLSIIHGIRGMAKVPTGIRVVTVPDDISCLLVKTTLIGDVMRGLFIGVELDEIVAEVSMGILAGIDLIVSSFTSIVCKVELNEHVGIASEVFASKDRHLVSNGELP